MRIFAIIGVIVVLAGVLVFAVTRSDGVRTDASIRVESAYVRATGANAKSGAAFMVIHNQSDQADRLIGVTTDSAAKVELHTHVENSEGVMMMRQIEGGIELPRGGKAKLKRGGDHVMLMGLDNQADRKTIKLILTFEKAGDVVIDVPVDNNR